MPQSTHDRAAELHNLAAHAHAAAAVAHGKGEHLTAHELSKQAIEHSMNAHKLAEEARHEGRKVQQSVKRRSPNARPVCVVSGRTAQLMSEYPELIPCLSSKNDHCRSMLSFLFNC